MTSVGGKYKHKDIRAENKGKKEITYFITCVMVWCEKLIKQKEFFEIYFHKRTFTKFARSI